MLSITLLEKGSQNLHNGHYVIIFTGNPADSRLVGGKTCPRIANPQTSRTMGKCALS